ASRKLWGLCWTTRKGRTGCSLTWRTTRMRTTSFLLGATLALAISLAALPANAIAPQQPGAVMHITPAASTPAPLGLQIFCMRSPAHCAAAPATQLRMDENLMTLLN